MFVPAIFCFLSYYFLLWIKQGIGGFSSPSYVCVLNLRSSDSLNFLMHIPQISKQWHRIMSHKTPGIPLITHYPSRPMLTVPIASLYILCSLIISKKFNTIATPTLEKLIVANMMEGPSEPCLYIPQILDSLILNREQQTIYEINAITIMTKALITSRLSMSSSHPRNEYLLVRNTCVSARVISAPKNTKNMAIDLNMIGLRVRCQTLLNGVTCITLDYRLLFWLCAYTTSSYRIAQSTNYYCVLLSLLIRAMILFISRWCSMEDQRLIGQVQMQFK